MWDTPGRLLRVLELLQQRREWGAAELAERLGVSTRTIRRDVDRLRAIGYPVEARYGADGGYHLVPGANLPPLMFDADEAVSTVLALQAFSASGDEPSDGSALRALVKLVGVMPRRLRSRVEALVSGVRQTDAGTIRGQQRAPVDMDTLVAAALACRDRRRSTTSHDGVQLVLDPLSLVRAGQRWYLVAWDVTAAGWRTLRLDQLVGFTATDRPATHREPPSEDLEDYVVQHLGRQIQQHRASVRVAAPAARVTPWIDPAFGWIEPIDDTACIVHSGSKSLTDVARWMLLLDAELTIIGPAELAAEYVALAKQAARIAATFPAGA
ncbi:helix-turn-helix transcriptional regulator [Pseudonocardia sp. GCM10023141]|uniref:helix-turn-helix transcriptional regulator n=1 Tax=Pseudonocardia sp. GCM10023141 TaxID=3252653 RepID=UPI003612E591